MATSSFYPHSPQASGTAPAMKTGAAQPSRALQEQLASLQLEFAATYRELYEAAQLQRTLSGPRLLRRDSFEIAAEIFPVRHLSGDFFNVSDAGAATLLAVGDIAGKGLFAGMWFTHLLGLTRMYGGSEADPGVALAAINRQMCASHAAPPLTSLFLARLDCTSGELIYSNAGHPAPVLVRGGELRLLNDGGPVLGAVPDARFASTRVCLRPGDTLVGYSDGLLECRNEDGEEFGLERVLNEVRNAAGSPASAMLFSIIGAAQDFAGTHAREDDCTLMVIQCRPRDGEEQ
jgi:sigma-B regulation protein RsbU (phosphoserine phosphatase)